MIRYFWVLRAYALKAGELTRLGDDIFFLEAAEIVRALNGETISPAVIKNRRIAYEGTAGGHRQLFIVSAAGSTPVRVLTDSFDDKRPSWR